MLHIDEAHEQFLTEMRSHSRHIPKPFGSDPVELLEQQAELCAFGRMLNESATRTGRNSPSFPTPAKLPPKPVEPTTMLFQASSIKRAPVAVALHGELYPASLRLAINDLMSARPC